MVAGGIATKRALSAVGEFGEQGFAEMRNWLSNRLALITQFVCFVNYANLAWDGRSKKIELLSN